MSAERPQRTIRETVETRGVGLHSGVEVTVRFRPAPPGSGVIFRRTDIPGSPAIPARVQFRVDEPRRTALRQAKGEVHTVEHMLSAASALGIDNLMIEMDGVEAPGLDGSSANFLELLEQAGLEEQSLTIAPFEVTEAVTVEQGAAKVTAEPNPGGGLHVHYTLDYPGVKGLEKLVCELDVTLEAYRELIAPARTFCLEQEAKMLQAAGLGKGATTENTVVWGDGGALETTLRFEDEPCRHKVLDLIGDLALLGKPLNAKITAVRSGHDLNAALVAKLLGE